MTSETRSRNASAKTRVNEKMRSRSKAQSPAHTPLVGAGRTSQTTLRGAWSSREAARGPMERRHDAVHAHDEECERREGQGGIVGQRGGQPQTVVVPPVLESTQGRVPEGCDRHGSSLLHKVAPIERAPCITLRQ